MKKLKYFIVEDDDWACDMAKSIIDDTLPNFSFVGGTGSIFEAQLLIKEMQPDVLLLDVNLPDGTAFELLKLVENENIQIVFITSYSKHAPDAFKAYRFRAYYFLEKPYDPEEFITILNKVNTRFQKDLEFLKLKDLEERSEKIQIKSRQGTRLLKVKDIVQIVACSNYSDIYLTNHEKITVSKCLNEFVLQLEDLGFIKTHRSHLINIEKLHSYCSNTNLVCLAYDLKAPVSRKYKKGLIDYLQKFEDKGQALA